MVLPFVLDGAAAGSLHHAHAAGDLPVLTAHAAIAVPPLAATLLVAGTHTAGYLLVTAALSLLVYYKAGLRVLRTMWINLDLIWAVVLILSGVVTLVH